jgi:hypothetical protein
MHNKYEIAVYYFPNYHRDERNEKCHGRGWTEWELVKKATPRFEGHRQPKVPLWGYEDEADPRVMEKKINVAADHGINVFIFDWYWYDDGPFLQRCLEEGYLMAKNNDRLKFSLMWANHDWGDIHPAKRMNSWPRVATGSNTKEVFLSATGQMINHYFNHPSYWRVDGGLYLSFYDVAALIKGLEGVENTKRVLDDFRERVRKAGLGEVHLNGVVLYNQILAGEQQMNDFKNTLTKCGFNSITPYVWVHLKEMLEFPLVSYTGYKEKCFQKMHEISIENKLPFLPNVTMGWDSSPRTVQSEVYDNLGYPFTPILDGNTPDEFKKALIQAKEFLDMDHVKLKILTINAWNEWTEGSYLEPDTKNGMGYLEAIRDVFSNDI